MEAGCGCYTWNSAVEAEAVDATMAGLAKQGYVGTCTVNSPDEKKKFAVLFCPFCGRPESEWKYLPRVVGWFNKVRDSIARAIRPGLGAVCITVDGKSRVFRLREKKQKKESE